MAEGRLRGKVALVTGATRGAGRGIAVALGAAGATVYGTGRSTRERRSEMNRPETIEDTADLVTAAGGEGIAVAVRPPGLRRGAARSWSGSAEIRDGSTCWSTTSGAARTSSRGTSRCGSTSLEDGLRLLRLAVDTHIITSHHALPLLIERPGGLVVEVTDGTADYNADHYRVSFFYDLAKTSAIRMALRPGAGAAAHGAHGGRAHARAGCARRSCSSTTASPRRTGATGTARQPHFGISEIAVLRRPRRRRARRRPGRRPLERAVAVQRGPRAGLRVHRRRRERGRTRGAISSRCRTPGCRRTTPAIADPYNPAPRG